MKSVALLCFIFIFCGSLSAQTEQLLIKTSSKGNYVDHKVDPKENFYSIGRLFNVHPKHIASFNGLDMSKGLHLGQTIKIPLSDTNFNQKSNHGTPVYYVTAANETLYKVSTNNGVLMEKLKTWNHLANDKPTAGSKLIIGYLVNGEAQALAVNTAQKTDPVKVIPDQSKDIVKNVPNNKPDAKKTEVKKDEIKKEETKKDDARDTSENSKKAPETSTSSLIAKPAEFDQGYFKTSFEQQVKQLPVTREQAVTSGTFKTSSGWADAKYYLLMDGADPGTIVRITNPTNNRIIFAKILGEMTDLRQNQGLNVRISNAAAAALDISETDKFIVKINY